MSVRVMRWERRLGLNYRKSLARLFQLTNADTRCRLVLMNMTNQPGGGTQILFNPFETALLLPPRHPRTHNKSPPPGDSQWTFSPPQFHRRSGQGAGLQGRSDQEGIPGG